MCMPFFILHTFNQEYMQITLTIRAQEQHSLWHWAENRCPLFVSMPTQQSAAKNGTFSPQGAEGESAHPSLLYLSWDGMALWISWYSSLLSRNSAPVDITRSSGAWRDKGEQTLHCKILSMFASRGGEGCAKHSFDFLT